MACWCCANLRTSLGKMVSTTQSMNGSASSFLLLSNKQYKPGSFNKSCSGCAFEGAVESTAPLISEKRSLYLDGTCFSSALCMAFSLYPTAKMILLFYH